MASDKGGDAGAGRGALGGLLRAYRERALLTQEQLADRAGVSVRTIRDLERGRIQRPLPATVRLLADALGIPEQQRALPTTADRAPAASPPLCHLPMDVGGFTGRAECLARLDGLLPAAADGPATAVVISAIAGTAGVGKTALAVHWAHRVRERFGDGQLYVDLHGHATGPPLSRTRALAQLLRALGMEPDRVPLEEEAAAGLYRSLLAGKRMLVVLDNARDAEQVRPLLPGSPGCLALVTSRDRLAGLVASHGASRLTLDVLPRGEAVALLARIVGQERVAAEPEAAAGLAEACAHLPLALRIAAANLACQPDQPISAYLARLRGGDQLAELAVDGDPHAAVAGAFECSYAALDADARRLFRLLGLVPGPELTAEAAAALAGLPVTRAERLLERLAGAHLVEPRAPGRFAFHDLLRAYARQRAGDDPEAERRQALRRLLDWYLHLADSAARLVYTQVVRLPVPHGEVPPAARFDRPDQALAWLDAERPNLVAAVQHAAGAGLRPHAWLLADALRGYFWLRRDLADWLLVAEAGIGAAAADGDLRAQAANLLSRGDAGHCSGRFPEAVEHYGAALELARRAGWRAGHAAALGNLGNVYWDMGQLRRAAAYHTRALGLYRRSGDRDGQATSLCNLGVANRELGRLRQAARQQAEALALFRATGSRTGEAIALANLGEVDHALGRLDQASEHLTGALAQARETGGRYLEASTLYDLAAVERDAGHHPRALELASDAVALAGEIGDPRIEAETLSTLGSVELQLGRCEEAVAHLERSLALAHRTGARYAEAEALLGLAAASQQSGDDAGATGHAERALAIAGRAGFRVHEAQAHAVLAGAHLARGRNDRAVEHAEQAIALQRRSGARLGLARALVTLGHALPPAGAAARWREALALLTEIGSPEAEQVRASLESVWTARSP